MTSIIGRAPVLPALLRALEGGPGDGPHRRGLPPRGHPRSHAAGGAVSPATTHRYVRACGSTKESTLAIKDTKCQEQISEYCTASVNSLPTLRQPSRNAQPPTGVMLNPVPGPRTHDGILAQPQDEEETAKTYNLIEEHVAGGFLFP